MFLIKTNNFIDKPFHPFSGFVINFLANRYVRVWIFKWQGGWTFMPALLKEFQGKKIGFADFLPLIFDGGGSFAATAVEKM
ncbi:MAG: hypothetical protein R2825_29915 [Saprospiraceae bacterium]